MTQPPTFVLPVQPSALAGLLTAPGVLRADFAGVDDDTLRLALSQAIDVLERFDELVSSLTDLSQAWRNQPKPNDQEWERDLGFVKETPRVPPAGPNPWGHCTWTARTGGHPVELHLLDRGDLEEGLRNAFLFAQRIGGMAGFLHRESERAMGGALLQAENLKPEPGDHPELAALMGAPATIAQDAWLEAESTRAAAVSACAQGSGATRATKPR